MKGGISSNCSKGRHISILLVALIFTTTLLWAWEKNPLATILPSAKDMFIMPSSSGYLVGAPNHSSLTVNPKEKVDGKDEHSVIKEANGKGNNDFKSADSDAKSTTPRGKERAESSIYSKPMKDCNYAKGRWVESSKRPLYSGFRCKQWLSIMWACRLTKRMDFSFEGYQWQPENCQMPDFDRFTFLKRMQNKTIAFIGDSLGRQQFQSLMCMISGGEDNPEVEDVGKEYDLVKAPGAIRPDGWVYRFPTTNLTVLYYWSASLCDLEPINATDKETNIAMHLDRPPSFMSRFLHRFDILVLNTGHHWNRGKLTANKWVMYKDGRPLEENNYLADIGNAKNFTVYSIVRWVDSQISIRPWLKAFFRTISPRHFFNGDWNTGGTCDNTSPMSGGSEVVQDGSVDSVVEDAVKGTRVKILDVTAISQLRDEGHVSRYSHRGVLNVSDCLHWCLPGIPDAWNEILLAQV